MILTLIVYILLPLVISVILLLIIRRHTHFESFESHKDVAGFIYSIIGMLYGVLLAFCVFVVWEEFRESETDAALEANCCINVSRDVNMLTDSVKFRILDNVYEYTRRIVTEEFPAMQNDTTSEEVTKAYKNIWLGFENYVPAGEYNLLWYKKSIDELNELAKQRRLRIFSMNQCIPGFMWIVLVFGALLTIAFSFLFMTKKLWPQLVMVIMLTLSISLVFLLITALNRPFSGIIQVSPEPYERAVMVIGDMLGKN